MKKAFGGLLLAALLLLGAWYYWSPGATFRALRASARAGDAEAIDEHVDFTAVRHNLKTDLREFMQRQADARSDDPLAQLGVAIGGFVADRAIDGFVSPEGIAAATRGRTPDASARTAEDEDDYTIERQGLNQFTVRFDRSQAERKVALVFTRDGTSWNLTRIRLIGDDT